MYVCPNCNTKTEEQINFCFNCGAQMLNIEEQPEEQQFSEAQQSYQYQQTQSYQEPQQYQSQPVYQAYQPISKPHLAVKIVGMALSIAGAAMLSIGALYTMIGLVEDGMAFAFALTFGLFFAPLCIVGLCLSNKCIYAGDYSAMSRVGKMLGIAGLIIAGVSLFIGITALLTY